MTLKSEGTNRNRIFIQKNELAKLNADMARRKTQV